MLSKSSFNALLKTLEEPPDHLVFLMATTEIEKVPNTVLSRCLQLNLKVVPLQSIAEHVKKLLDLEDLQSDGDSIVLIAKAAQGSIRDALTLTDQAIAHGNGALVKTEVANFLGSIDDSHLFAVIRNILLGDGDATYISLQALYEFNVEYSLVLKSFIEHFHSINMAKASLGSNLDAYQDLADLADAEFLHLLQEIFLQSLEKYNVYPDPRLALEAAVLRSLAFHPLKVEGATAEKKNLKKPKPLKNETIQAAQVSEEIKPIIEESEAKFSSNDWTALFHLDALSNITKEVFFDFGFKQFSNGLLILLQPEKAMQPTDAMIAELTEALFANFKIKPTIKFELTEPNIVPRDSAKKIAATEANSTKEELTKNSSVQYLIRNFDAKISINSD